LKEVILSKEAVLGSYWTLAVGTAPVAKEVCDYDLRQRIEAASAAGYTGMGLWHSDLEVQREKYGLAEIGRMLKDNGIVHVELEWLNDWYWDDERRAQSDQYRKLLLETTEVIGASHIKVADLANDTLTADQMAEPFSQLCTEAAERGTNILFEMMPAPFSNLPTLDDVIHLVRASGAQNGGIMVDNLHMVRTGTTFAEMREKLGGAGLLLGVEINDGALAMPVDFMDSVINRRLLPGDGEFDIPGFLDTMWSIGFEGPIGVEVMNEYFRRWPLDAMAQTSFAKTCQVIEEARALGSSPQGR
jgi:sugar phosphate isomerase/epimerase